MLQTFSFLFLGEQIWENYLLNKPLFGWLNQIILVRVPVSSLCTLTQFSWVESWVVCSTQILHYAWIHFCDLRYLLCWVFSPVFLPHTVLSIFLWSWWNGTRFKKKNGERMERDGERMERFPFLLSPTPSLAFWFWKVFSRLHDECTDSAKLRLFS